MDKLREAKINTAGAYITINGLYPFALGSKLHSGRIPVIRLGGHREANETGWECAAREVYEEATLRISPLLPRTTYLADGDHPDDDIEEIRWATSDSQENIPILVVAYQRESGMLLSLMYLAQAEQQPIPASEIKGLLLLDAKDIHRLCQEPLTLDQYFKNGGQAILNANFDHSLILEPFAQLRLLSKILRLQPIGSVLVA